MAVQAPFGGFAGAGCLPLPYDGGFAEEQVRLLRDYGALLSSTATNNGYHHHCPAAAAVVVSGAQSELTCNGSGVLPPPSRKRVREAADYCFEEYNTVVPGTQKPSTQVVVDLDTATASTSGRTLDALVLSELCRRQGAEIDALVRAECARLQVGLKRQRLELAARAVAAARGLREKEAELDAARRLAAELEERVRQAAAESQAWCGLARGHEAVAAELRATLDHLLLCGAAVEEGFGESDCGRADDDDAQSCCLGVQETPGAATATPTKWACKACGEREASVLLLPCRHLCLCKACEPRTDACPVCLATKTASIHVAAN